MKKQTSKQSSCEPQPGAPTEAGQGVNPADLPPEDASAEERHSRNIPIGHAVSPERYRQLKEQAKKTNLPPTGSAQEDV